MGGGTARGGHLACTEKIRGVQFPYPPPVKIMNSFLANKPCSTCIVRVCCSDRCIEYATYIIDNIDTSPYKNSNIIKKAILNKEVDKAVNHILLCERLDILCRDIII